MFLRKLNLFHFKNIEEARFEFESNVICLLGRNGSGKTNLLDAIYYLSFTKSAINPSDPQNVKLGQNQFINKGEFELNGRKKEVTCSFQIGQKKVIREDGQDYTKFSEHVGKYPVVLIAPQDIELIWDGSELRRRFFDTLISQLDKIYLENLITYTNHLKQRNSLLRMFSETGNVDRDMLASYDQKIIPAGNYINNKRQKFIVDFLPFLTNHYEFLSESNEEVNIQYYSDLQKADFESLLQSNLQRDILLQRTSSGVHRDDFDFLMNGNELKKFGSQGQQKSFLIALKLAEFQCIAEAKQFKPILLLDDIFDKLDDQRIGKLMRLVSLGTFGQLFLTDARAGRSWEILKEAQIHAQVFIVENGTFSHG
ncbi:MAG: DNA replication and repair protein RecF [Cyclobacteriaceae bacterium]|nr:DNA replication and repair protein RecF [Cyclobacteriaceae bacterium]